MARIHPLAVVSGLAEVGQNVTIGPFCVIEPGVQLGDDCILESHVILKQGARIGPRNHLFEGCVIGGLPQHARMPTQVGAVEVGSDNVLREHTTIHRALHPDAATRVGDRNLMMVNTHIAHDCVVGSHAIFANNALLGGHVLVEDRAYVSGAVAVHQFCRVGAYAMVGGHARIIKDVPPFMTVDGQSGLIVGLNSIGLRRNGFSVETIFRIKAAYRVLYRSGLTWNEILARLREEYTDEHGAHLLQFLEGTRRGITSERRLPPGSTLKLHVGEQTAAQTNEDEELREAA